VATYLTYLNLSCSGKAAIDAQGRIYFFDFINESVVAMDPKTAGVLYSVRLTSEAPSQYPFSALAVDGAGNIYVTGNARSSGLPITPGSFQPQKKSPSFSDTVFVAKVSP